MPFLKHTKEEASICSILSKKLKLFFFLFFNQDNQRRQASKQGGLPTVVRRIGKLEDEARKEAHRFRQIRLTQLVP